jgi:hypothetical protein
MKDIAHIHVPNCNMTPPITYRIPTENTENVQTILPLSGGTYRSYIPLDQFILFLSFYSLMFLNWCFLLYQQIDFYFHHDMTCFTTKKYEQNKFLVLFFFISCFFFCGE